MEPGDGWEFEGDGRRGYREKGVGEEAWKGRGKVWER